MRPISRSVIVLLFLAMPGLVGVARADDRQVAREAYREGSRQFEIGDYEAALEAFKKAYVAYEDPAFLFNIAQCERLLNRKQEALRTYKVYLLKVPDAPNADDVKKIVATLEEAIEKEKQASSMPPMGSEAPHPTPPPETGTVKPPAPAPQAAAPAPAPAPKPENPLLKKWWFWTAIGGGVVVVAAVVTGIAVGVTSYHPDFHPTLPDVGPATMGLTVHY